MMATNSDERRRVLRERAREWLAQDAQGIVEVTALTDLLCAVEAEAEARERERCASALVEWARERWDAEVKHRPEVNVHRRTLDGTWKQVERDGPAAIRARGTAK